MDESSTPKSGRTPPGWLVLGLVGATFATLVWLETRRPLRQTRETKSIRNARNLAVATLTSAASQLVSRPILRRLTCLVERKRWGLLQQWNLPRGLEVVLGVLLMDYTLYLWHILTHEISFLWRFHQVHHVDLDLDASTALRFHFGEITIATLWHSGQVLVLGVRPQTLAWWQAGLILSILFHHSNARLPYGLERWLNYVVVTPRMHGIHHSVVREETNSNWSSGLTVWDYLHGTLRLDVPQDAVDIGVPAYRDPQDVTLPKVLEMPFTEQRPSWLLPDGRRPSRPALRPGSHGHLLP